MAFDGFGTFLRLRSWVVDATNSVKIRADFHDDEDNNFADGLSHCITKDGQTLVTQNIPLNSRRIISLADPIDPQDASTKDYADTKAPLAGGVPFTGDVVIKEASAALTLDGTPGNKNSIFGQKSDKNRWEIVLGDATAESGSNAGSDFELINYADDGTLIGNVLFGTRSTGLLTIKADPTVALGVSTKQYADATAINAASSKLAVTGGTVTGNLQVNGELLAAAGYLRFTNTGGSGYIQWNGGANYTLGGGGTIWHSGNLAAALPLAGGTMTGVLRTAPGGQIGGPGSTGTIEVRGGASGNAGMSFVGSFAANFGLDSSGNFYMGGWSHGANVYKFWTTRDFTNVPATHADIAGLLERIVALEAKLGGG